MSLSRGELGIQPVETGPDDVYLAHGAAADIWIVSSAQRPKHIRKVIRVNPERLRRNAPHGGSNSQPSNSPWQDFIKEYDTRVAVWSALSHANIVRVFGTSGKLNLEVEYHGGGCARDYLKAHSSTVDKLAMILDVLAGVQYLHQHSPPIVHGNINAGKIFVDCHGKTAIGEFGLAALCSPFAAYAPSVSFTGLTRWFSPELLDNDVDYIPHPTLVSDI
ncbi:hypothetical protein FS749_016120 [Ceratobasidium sp. UAMH 11750]|nr:hypothetical protein FS749_016120 [Ceratobasidium sp. UAMH 11750]